MAKNQYNPELFKYNTQKKYAWMVYDKVTIATITCNRLEHTKKLIESLFKFTHLPYDLLIIDNASTDGSIEYLRKLAINSEHITLLENKKNIGKSRALLQLRNHLSHGLIIYFDNDVEILSNYWLVHIQKAYHATKINSNFAEVALSIPTINMQEYGFRYASSRVILEIPTEQNSEPRTSFAKVSKDTEEKNTILDEQIIIGKTQFLIGQAFSCSVENFKKIKLEDVYPKKLGGVDSFCSQEFLRLGITMGYIENGPIARHNDWPYSNEKLKLYNKTVNQRTVTDWLYIKWKLKRLFSK